MLRKAAKTMVLGLFVSTHASAEYKTGAFPTSIDEAYEIEAETPSDLDCYDQFDESKTASYCIQRSISKTSKDIYLEAYIIIGPNHQNGAFQTKEDVVNAYLRVDKWPSYVERSPVTDVTKFPVSTNILDDMLPNGDRHLVHHFSYEVKAPIIGRLKILGTSDYKLLGTPNPGAVISATQQNTKTWGHPWQPINEIPGATKQQGIKGHDTNINIVDLKEDGFLVVYRTRIQTTTPAPTSLTNMYVVRALEDILTGMFYLTPNPR